MAVFAITGNHGLWHLLSHPFVHSLICKSRSFTRLLLGWLEFERWSVHGKGSFYNFILTFEMDEVMVLSLYVISLAMCVHYLHLVLLTKTKHPIRKFTGKAGGNNMNVLKCAIIFLPWSQMFCICVNQLCHTCSQCVIVKDQFVTSYPSFSSPFCF